MPVCVFVSPPKKNTINKCMRSFSDRRYVRNCVSFDWESEKSFRKRKGSVFFKISSNHQFYQWRLSNVSFKEGIKEFNVKNRYQPLLTNRSKDFWGGHI